MNHHRRRVQGDPSEAPPSEGVDHPALVDEQDHDGAYDDEGDDEDDEYRRALQVLQEFHRAHSLDVIYEHAGGAGMPSMRRAGLRKTRTAVSLLDLAADLAAAKSSTPSGSPAAVVPPDSWVDDDEARNHRPPLLRRGSGGSGAGADWGFFLRDDTPREAVTGSSHLLPRKPPSSTSIPYHQHRHFQRRLRRSIRFSAKY